MSNPCEQLKQEYKDIEAMAKEFDLELDKAITGARTPKEADQALERAKELKAKLEQSMASLCE